jgi:hypothetical protein
MPGSEFKRRHQRTPVPPILEFWGHRGHGEIGSAACICTDSFKDHKRAVKIVTVLASGEGPW